MRALEVQALTGPDGVAVVDRDEPTDDGTGVVIDVVATGVSFPDLLQSKGLYQYRPDPPFVPGIELAGTVRSAPASAGFQPGDRVCAWTRACMAEVAVAAPAEVFHLPEQLTWDEGAALIMNYQTAVFCMIHRGGLAAGESLLVLGASGGVGTSGIQVAKAIGAGPIIGLVSTQEKGEVARKAGADDIVLVSDTWKDDVRALTGGHGVDMVYDPVGGDRFLDGIRSLARFGRLVVVGFAEGTIPEVKVNRLLLRNVSVVGAAWGEAVAGDPSLPRRIHDELLPMISSGAIKPPIGAVLPLDRGADAYRMLDERQAVGKVVIRARNDDGSPT
ncbi:MAG: NADPH:quinone oxidoreductase family protein [Acidimicrobiia bacterium]|nr:NADPH:quinone oxidoreductase family protein [Acidimicrobiia bacterium]